MGLGPLFVIACAGGCVGKVNGCAHLSVGFLWVLGMRPLVQ